MYKNNMIVAIALWRTPKGHCAEAEDSVRRREILLPSKRPMTEERESAPNQAPDTDQATHQRPPQASLARRYMGKLLANIATVPVYLIMEAVLPRALGPQVYGNFNFSTSVFTQLTGFLDMGTSTCFYNALSRRQYEMPLVAFYGRVSALVFLVTMLAGVFLLVPGLGDMLLPDVPLWYAPLAAFYGFLLWGTRVVRSMNDALGLTVPGELLRSGVNLLGAIIILALFWFGFLNAGSLFGLQYLMMGSIVIGCLAIMRRSWAHIDLSLTRDQRLSYTREFSDYSMPLFVQALLSALALSAERWVLQWFDGSTQQGYFALSQRVSAACFLFVSAMTPLIMRELAIAWGKDDREHMGHLLTRFAPLLFGIAAWFSCFTAVEASVLVHIFGGAEFAAALVPVQIMALYPAHQAYGQLASSVFHATGKTKVLRNLAFIEHFLICLKHTELNLGSLVASGLGLLLDFLYALLYGLEVFDEQFGVDDLLVAHGIDSAVDMGYIVVVETAQHVDNGVGLAYVGQELVAETLPLAGTFDKAGDVDNLNGCGHHGARLAHLDEARQTVVGHGDDAHIGLDCAEREIGALGLCVRQAVEKRRLADIGQSDDTTFQGHNRFNYNFSAKLAKKTQRRQLRFIGVISLIGSYNKRAALSAGRRAVMAFTSMSYLASCSARSLYFSMSRRFWSP